ncbi:hypothetical protein [Microvirga roseola]|uniref:hypothetical protein n=1 Tax=Microvirga roseola TaxID=2883126 RepID=UPI001E369D42|nr:hypothetical protein [Microvirga roseola]
MDETAKARSVKVERILKVQRQLHKLSELKLVRLERAIVELRAEEAALIESLNDSDALQGLFVDARAKRLQSLAGQVSQTEATKLVQGQRTLDRAMQAKRAERMADRLEKEDRRQGEKKSLQEILDRLPAKRDASLP